MRAPSLIKPGLLAIAAGATFALTSSATADGMPSGHAVIPPAPRPAAHHDIRVPLDQAVPLRLEDSAEGVAVGNPSIAGVSVQNNRLLFVTGRSYGATNLVVVGANGQTIYSGRITVIPDETNVVMITRGAETTRMECTPQCRPRPDIGDSNDEFQTVNAQITNHASAASAGGGH